MKKTVINYLIFAVSLLAQFPVPGSGTTGGGGGGGGISVSAGDGVTVLCPDGLPCTVSINDTLTLTRARGQAGSDHVCSDSGGDDDYTCTPEYTPAVYPAGMEVRLFVTTANTGPATVNFGGLGVKNILTSSGATPATGDIATGRVNLLHYDGTAFRIVGGASTVTDSRWLTYMAAGSTVGTADNQPGGGWYYPYQVAQVINGTAGGFRGILMRHTTSDYAEYRFRLPETWTGTLGFKAFWTLRTDNSGAGTGRHDYDMACMTPVADGINTALSYSTATQVAFNFTGAQYNNGQLDTVTLTLGTGCAAGDIAVIRMTRVVTGTSIDNTSLVYFSIQAPSTL